ncbi:MAG: porin [Pseudohongiellaceae bacterium]|nr:porin [Pseudohongiellaceae bacterium]
MKSNSVLPLVVVASLGASLSAQAQENDWLPSFYGRINANIVVDDSKSGGSDSDVVSNASRLGLRGDIALTDSIKLVYQAEYQLNPDEGLTDGQFFTQRNSYVGLDGGFGRLLFGRNDSPAKQLQNGIDLFNDLNGDIKYLFPAENRLPDVVHYTSPEFGGFSVSYSAVLKGNEGSDRLTENTSVALRYEQENWYAGVAVDSDIKGYDTLRFVTKYTVGNLQLGALYETSEKDGSPRGDQDGVFFSASYKIDNYVLKAQTGASDEKNDGGQQHSIGFDYKFNSDLKTFVTYTMTRADGSAKDNDQLGLGVEWRF